MNKSQEILLSVLPWIGIVTGLSATIIKAVDPSANWTQYIIGISIGALWPAFIIYSSAMTKHMLKIEGIINSLLQVDSATSVLERAMQAGFFTGSHIDDQFWLAFCKRINVKTEKDAIEMLKLILSARESGIIQVQPQDVYYLMKVLCQRVVEEDGKYCAIATEADIPTTQVVGEPVCSDSEFFLFNFPLSYPKNIRRLFVVKSLDSLASLPDPLKSKLVKQIELGVELHYSIKPKFDFNYGIYGNIAVGSLNNKTRKNEVNFDSSEASRRRQDFDERWKDSTPLSKRDLGFVNEE